MSDIIIKNVEELKNYCDKVLANLDTDDAVDLSQFQGGLKLHIVGEKYHSSLDTSIMEYFVTFQKNINDIYSIKKYGKVQILSAEEKEKLRVFVGVEPGSTLAEIKNLFDIMLLISGGKIQMTTGGVLAILGAVTIFAVGHYGYKAWASQKKTEVEKLRIEKEAEVERRRLELESQRVELEEQRLKDDQERDKKEILQYRIMEKMFDASLENNSKMFRSLAAPEDAIVNMNGKEIPVEMLKDEAKKEKVPEPLRDEALNGLFKVLNVTFDYTENASVATVQFLKTGERIKGVNLQDCYLSPEKLAFIKDAEKKEPIELNINVNRKGNKIENAYLKLEGYINDDPRLRK